MTTKKRMGKRDARNWLYDQIAADVQNMHVDARMNEGEYTAREIRLIEGEREYVAARIRKHIVQGKEPPVEDPEEISRGRDLE